MKKILLMISLFILLTINTTFAFSFGFSSFWSKMKNFFTTQKIVQVQNIATTTPIIYASTTNKEIKKIKKEDNIISNKVSNIKDDPFVKQTVPSDTDKPEFITLPNGDMQNTKTGQIFKGVASQVAEATAKADTLNVINAATAQKQALLNRMQSDCVDSINSLTQQIIDTKTKYFSDLDNLEKSGGIDQSQYNGMANNLLNNANLKIEQLKNQIQQKKLNCLIKYGN